jgi:hypothetical protein
VKLLKQDPVGLLVNSCRVLASFSSESS